MYSRNKILQLIKVAVLAIEPLATVVLYGSYARGEQKPDSDIDILILLNKEKVTIEDKMKISSRLYDLELESGIIISPNVYAKNQWGAKVTPFFENVNREGVVL